MSKTINIELIRTAVAEALSLEVSEISPNDTFSSLGGDSLAALFVLEKIQSEGFLIDPIILFDGGSFLDIAAEMIEISK